MKKNTQKMFSVLLLTLTVFFGIWIASYNISFVWYWVFGIIFGIILQRSRLCFVSAASDPILINSTDQFRAILVSILISSFGIAVFKYLSHGTYDMLGVSAISLPLVLGSFIFGIGMILAGCCSSGMFIRLAEGYVIHIITFVCVIIGFVFATSHYQELWAPFVAKSPVVFLPEKAGWVAGIALHLFLIIFLHHVAVRYEEKSTTSSNDSIYLKGAVLLALFNILHFIILESGWSVTGAFFWISELFRDTAGNDTFHLLDNQETFFSFAAPNIRNLGLFVGALFSVLTRNCFHLKRIRSGKQIEKSIAGGFLMGYGACLAGGCNISAFYVAASSLSLSAWIFMIFLFLGASLGIKILYKIM